MLENTADMPYSLPEYRGEYKMEGRLGESGSGPVYSARDAFGRPLAIKVLTGPLPIRTFRIVCRRRQI